MDRDYLLIAVDSERKFAIRLLSLEHCVKESLELQRPGKGLAGVYANFLLASVILGSRTDDQEAMLFKLQFTSDNLSINCEVNPRGALRSAIFPSESRDVKSPAWDGFLKVVRLKKGDEAYESVIAIGDASVAGVMQSYLSESVQTPSLLCLNADPADPRKCFALWIEKLPGTSETEWKSFSAVYKDGSRFRASLDEPEDPDVVVRKLFDNPITILAVTKPKLTCSCSKKKVLDALALLPVDDLTDIFMAGEGVSTQCDYCHKVWEIDDAEVKTLLGMGGTIH